MSEALLKQLVEDHPISSFMNYRDYLKTLYQGMKDNLPQYSYNQFSEDLGLGYSNVAWLIITDRRRLTKNTATKIQKSLDLAGREAKYFNFLMEYNNCRQANQKEKYFKQLLATKTKLLEASQQKSELEYLSKWYHPIIREMCGMKEFVSEARWILSRLYCKLLPREVKQSLELLEELNLVTYSRRKMRHVATEENINPFTKASIRNLGTVGYHKKMMEIAADSLTKVPAKRRDYNAITIRVSENQFPAMKSIIHKACQDLVALEGDQSSDQIYQVNIQLFPFTKN